FGAPAVTPTRRTRRRPVTRPTFASVRVASAASAASAAAKHNGRPTVIRGSFAAVILAGGAGRRLGGAGGRFDGTAGPVGGGAGEHVGGGTGERPVAGKVAVSVGGTPMLQRVLAAVSHASPRVGVGPPALSPMLPDGVRLTLEEPPGGGPIAGLAAGLVAVCDPAAGSAARGQTAGIPVRREPEWTALLAADLPLLTPAAVDRLLMRAWS